MQTSILIKKFLILLLVALPIFVYSDTQLYDFKIIQIIDGDTVEIEAPYLPQPLNPSLKLRILGIDTPEKGSRAKCKAENDLAMAATNFLKDSIENARLKKIKLVKWDKYGGRVLGDIILDDHAASTLMIKNGFARAYFGEKKSDWCQK